MIISLIFIVLAAIGAGNMDFHDGTDGRIKSEQTIQALRGEELSYAVAEMLANSCVTPDDSILSTDEDYKLLIHYLCNVSEECSEGISLYMYNIFLFYPQKLDEAIKRIDALSEDKRKEAEEQLCFYIFSHYCAYYRYDLDGFLVRFPLLEKKYKDIIQSIYERSKPFDDQ